jgi:hypothetical protein
MYKNSALLSFGAVLLLSLFVVDGGHAFQIDRNQNAGVLMAGDMKGTGSLLITQVSNRPNPCGGRTGVTCSKESPPGSGAKASDGSRYTSQVSNTPIPCGGRTGASCRNGSPAGSSEMATDGSGYTMTKSVVGMLFGAGLFALVGFGAGRLRHQHGDQGHHA